MLAQGAIFSYSDAVFYGIDKRLHSREISKKSWLKLERGIYLLSEFIPFLDNGYDFKSKLPYSNEEYEELSIIIGRIKYYTTIIASLTYTQKVAKGGMHIKSEKPMLGGSSAILKTVLSNFILHLLKDLSGNKIFNRECKEFQYKGQEFLGTEISKVSCIEILKLFNVFESGKIESELDCFELYKDEKNAIIIPSINYWKILKTKGPRNIKKNDLRQSIFDGSIGKSELDKFFYERDLIANIFDKKSQIIINEPFEIAILRLLHDNLYDRNSVEEIIRKLVSNGDFDTFLGSELIPEEIKGFILGISTK